LVTAAMPGLPASQDAGGVSPSVSEAIGEAWANEVANTLREQMRSLVGGWPGTMREARTRLLFGLRAARPSTFDSEELTALTRAVYEAARRSWDQIAAPDPEP
jgi:hypothetical protein